MKELKDYTDEELKSELKRRARANNKTGPREVIYIEFEATVKSIDNIDNTRCSDKVKYKPLTIWRYRVENWTTPIDITYHSQFYLKHGVFNKGTAPKVGDRVKLTYRRTKVNSERSDISNAKIIEIINQ